MSTFQTTYDPSTKTWSGDRFVPTFHPNVNAAQVVLEALHRNPDYIGQINENNGLMLSNREIALNTIRVAQNLQKLGIHSGDVVAVIAENHHHLASVVFASLALAAPVNFLGPDFSKAEITHMLELTQPKIVFCEKQNSDRVRDALKQIEKCIPIYSFDDDGSKGNVAELLKHSENKNNFIPALLTNGLAQAAVILCSSGTTGLPKGIPISHAMLLYQFNHQLDIIAGDRYFILCSHVWITAVIALFSTTLRGATRVITTNNISPELVLQIFDKFRITSSYISPYTLALILQSRLIKTVDLSVMKRLFCGGSAVPDAHRQRMNKFMSNGSINVVYGLSEVPGFLTCGVSPDPPSSVGLLGQGHSVQVRDPCGNLCGPNEEGELWFRVEIPCMGYWNDTENSKDLLDLDGWVRSGDIGRFDDKGNLFLTDRKKEMLKYRGRNISPTLMEKVVLSVKGVTAVCIVGVIDDDVEERPTALVVRDGQSAKVTEMMIHQLVEETMLEKGILCGGVYFVENLPKTHSGKIQRRGVKAVATELCYQRFTKEI